MRQKSLRRGRQKYLISLLHLAMLQVTLRRPSKQLPEVVGILLRGERSATSLESYELPAGRSSFGCLLLSLQITSTIPAQCKLWIGRYLLRGEGNVRNGSRTFMGLTQPHAATLRRVDCVAVDLSKR